jgi:hypothetical protein
MSAGIGPVAMRHLMACVGRSTAISLVAVLHGHVGDGARVVDPDVAGRLAGGDALGQLQVLAVPAVDVHVVQPVARGDEPLHVARELQLVRIDDAVDHALHLGGLRVQEGQRVARRIGHDDRLFVRRHVDVVRLLAGGDALLFAPVDRIDHAHAGVQRVENEDRRGFGRCGVGRLERQGRQNRQAGKQEGSGAAARSGNESQGKVPGESCEC